MKFSTTLLQFVFASAGLSCTNANGSDTNPGSLRKSASATRDLDNDDACENPCTALASSMCNENGEETPSCSDIGQCLPSLGETCKKIGMILPQNQNYQNEVFLAYAKAEIGTVSQTISKIVSNADFGDMDSNIYCHKSFLREVELQKTRDPTLPVECPLDSWYGEAISPSIEAANGLYYLTDLCIPAKCDNKEVLDAILRATGESFLFGGPANYVSEMVIPTSKCFMNLASKYSLDFCGLDQTCVDISLFDVDIFSNGSKKSLTQPMCTDGCDNLTSAEKVFLVKNRVDVVGCVANANPYCLAEGGSVDVSTSKEIFKKRKAFCSKKESEARKGFCPIEMSKSAKKSKSSKSGKKASKTRAK